MQTVKHKVNNINFSTEAVDSESLEFATWWFAEKEKLARLGCVSGPPCRASETNTASDKHGCRSHTWQVNQHPPAARCQLE